MTTTDSTEKAQSTENWDTTSHEAFFNYYAQQSLSSQTMDRFSSTCQTVLRHLPGHGPDHPLDVLDIGCGAGAQSRFWLEKGHRYWGLDINQPLIELARERAARLRQAADYRVGSATHLPFADGSIDVCLMPELLEHVADWQSCINEAVRVLRPGGVLYLSTTSKLCPKQQEFDLPLYSWYPPRLKRYFERRATSDWPAVANHAKYPAVNWFSFYSLRAFLAPSGFECYDRFDLIDLAHKGSVARIAVAMTRALPPLRWLGHMATSYTELMAKKPLGRAAHSV